MGGFVAKVSPQPVSNLSKYKSSICCLLKRPRASSSVANLVTSRQCSAISTSAMARQARITRSVFFHVGSEHERLASLAALW